MQAEFTPMGGQKAIGGTFTDKPVTVFGGLALFLASAQWIGVAQTLEAALSLEVPSPNATPPHQILLAFFTGARRFAQLASRGRCIQSCIIARRDYTEARGAPRTLDSQSGRRRDAAHLSRSFEARWGPSRYSPLRTEHADSWRKIGVLPFEASLHKNGDRRFRRRRIARQRSTRVRIGGAMRARSTFGHFRFLRAKEIAYDLYQISKSGPPAKELMKEERPRTPPFLQKSKDSGLFRQSLCLSTLHWPRGPDSNPIRGILRVTAAAAPGSPGSASAPGGTSPPWPRR